MGGMPRSGWKTLESDRRLPHLVSVGLLMKVFPAEVVDAVIAECGRTEQRRRSLPARSMAYFAMGMALHSEGSYEDVLALISDGIAWAHREPGGRRLANKAAISHAYDRLGAAPMALLFDRVATPLAARDTPGSWLAGRRLVAIDGTCLDLADTPGNEGFFGRPGVTRVSAPRFPRPGWSPWPSAAPMPSSTRSSGRARARRAPSPANCWAGSRRGCCAWPTAASTASPHGTARVPRGRICYVRVRVRDSLGLEPVEELPDGSWLAEVFDSVADRRRQRPSRVRVIEYTVEDGRDPAGPYRLLTTILHPDEAPAAELAAAYAQRWEIETAFGELKIHQRGLRAVLRSRSPELVLQEIWGHLCCHYAIRTLMFDAAEHAGHDPDRVSFVAALRISRTSIAQQGASPLTGASPASGSTPSSSSPVGCCPSGAREPNLASSNGCGSPRGPRRVPGGPPRSCATCGPRPPPHPRAQRI